MPTPKDRCGVYALIWERVTQFRRRPSPSAAKALLTLQFSNRDKARMQVLARKARAGTLSAEEEGECDSYEHIASLLGILHSQARRTLNRTKAAS